MTRASGRTLRRWWRTARPVRAERSTRAALLLALALSSAGCDESTARSGHGVNVGEVAGVADGLATGISSSGARFVQTILGFQGPESVRYDAEEDVFYVSNIAGYGSIEDSVAYISRIDAGDPTRVDVLVRSGMNGALMHAPKGLALQGDTLWVADIDVVRAFDRRNGAVLANVDLAPHGAVMLNDLDIGPDGDVYVTDSGIEMSPVGVLLPGGSKVFAIRGARHAVEVIAEGPQLEHPNGITWDPVNRRWLIVTFHPFRSSVLSLTPGASELSVIARGKGRFDGIALLEDGRMLVTAWADSSLHLIDGESDRRIVRELWQPADPGYDPTRNRVAIPLVLQGRVEFWEIPPR